jgi:hypothetical protein
MIARLDGGHTLTNRLDNTGTLMSKNNWEGALRIFA